MEKLVRTKFSGLDGKTIVAFSKEDDSFSIKADKAGIRIEGRLELNDQANLQEFAKLVSEAWTEHRKLIPQFSRSVTGH